MWYVYVLESIKNLTFYTGMTDDVERRLMGHNSKQGGEYTSKNGPFKLIFYEAYVNKKDATKAEKFFKSGYGREVFIDKIKNYLSEKK